MKNLSKIILIFYLCVCVYSNCKGQYITIQGKQLKDASGNNFYPLLCNYISELAFHNPNPTTNLFDPFNPDAYIAAGATYTFAQYQKYGPANNGCWGCGTEEFECSDWPSCSLDIIHDLTLIRSLGFNMIRPDFTPSWNKDIQKFTLKGHEFGLGVNNINGVFVTFEQPFDTDPDVINYLSYLDFLATQCGLLGMHLMINGLNGNVSDPIAEPAYRDFLTLLGNHFKNNPNLGFYDILNEPAYQYSWVTKTEACNLFAGWYNTLKTADPNHLITAGSTTLEETFRWDLSLMKVDFNQPHFYTDMHDFDNFDTSNQLNRIRGMMYWIDKNLPMPWIQGETSYRGADLPPGITLNPTIGSEAEQDHYIQETLKAARDYGSIGYVWWQYQDVSYPDPTDGRGLVNIYQDAANNPTTKSGAQHIFNYLDQNNQPPPPDPSQYVMPPNYYDPYLHATYSPNQNIIHGHVEDDMGHPIEDALVFGKTAVNLNQQLNPVWDLHYTFTNANGDFTFIPYDYDPFNAPNDNAIAEYNVSAHGCELSSRSGTAVVDNDYFSLKRVHFKYDNFISDKTIGTADYEKNLQGWNSLTTENITYQTDVTADLKARTEVHLLPPFDANTGSEVHIYTGKTFADCDAFSNAPMRISNGAIGQTNDIPGKNEIELQFTKHNLEFSFSVVPNPSNGKFTVSINSDFDYPFAVTLSDALGSILQNDFKNSATFIIDASNLKKGVYYLKVNSKTKKLIIL